MAALPEGGRLHVLGSAPEWDLHLRAWCRQQGHDGSLRGLRLLVLAVACTAFAVAFYG